MNPLHATAAVLLALASGVAAAASPFDGFWMIQKPDGSLDPGSQVEYRIGKEGVSMNSPTGASYRAKPDGSDAEVSNDSNTTSVSVRMPDRHTLVETAKNEGKPWRVTTIEVQPDGRTAKVTWKTVRGTSQSGSYVLTKQ